MLYGVKDILYCKYVIINLMKMFMVWFYYVFFLILVVVVFSVDFDRFVMKFILDNEYKGG